MRRLGELCELIDGSLIGDSSLVIGGAASISRAKSGEITLVTDEKYLAAFENSEASVAIAPRTLRSNKPLILCDQPETQFAKIVAAFRPMERCLPIGIHRKAFVSESAKISEDVDIHPGAVIGEDVEIGCGSVIHANATVMDRVRIGRGVQVFPGVVLYPNTIVGDRCLIHAGSVIGAYGFGYKMQDGRHQLAPQLGYVILESDVEVGAGVTIDRGTYDATVIGEGTKIDNQVMVGHNCQIGKHNLFCSQVGIAGSSSTGDYVVLAGQVGIGDHLHIGNRATIQAKSGIMHDIEDGQTMMGIPAAPVREHLQNVALQRKLPEMRRRISRVEKRIDQLSEQPSGDQQADAA